MIFASSSGERAIRRRTIMPLVAHRTNPLPLLPEKDKEWLHGQSLNVAKGAEEAEGVSGAHELGARASASGVSLPVVVVKVRRDRTQARLAMYHPLVEQHPAHGHDPSEEGCLKRGQDSDSSRTVRNVNTIRDRSLEAPNSL